jgi:hypothetical protein
MAWADWTSAEVGDGYLLGHEAYNGHSGGSMATYLNLKVEYEDELRKIPATEVKKEFGRLKVYNGDKLVGEFVENRVEHWSIDEAKPAAAVAAVGGFKPPDF